jgi:hypothetical protein
MGRRSGGCRTRGGSVSQTDPAAAGPPSAHFHRNPLGRSQLTVFRSGGCRTLSTCISKIWVFVTASPARTALKKQPTDLAAARQSTSYFGDSSRDSRHYVLASRHYVLGYYERVPPGQKPFAPSRAPRVKLMLMCGCRIECLATTLGSAHFENSREHTDRRKCA